MNTIYRIIWNRAKGEWTVASELAVAARGGKGKTRQNVHEPASVLRRLPWALACVLGGLAVCAPVVHASDTATSEHQQMEKVNSRLADLSGLLVKYGHASASVAQRVAPSTVATNPSVLPNQHVPAKSQARTASVARPPVVQLSAATTGHVVVPPKSQSLASPAVQATVQARVAPHVAVAAHVAASPAKVTAATHAALSPQLASNAQIAAVLAHGNIGSTGVSAVNMTDQAATWVVSSDGSLHAATANAPTHASAQKTSTWSGTAFTNVPATSTRRSASARTGTAGNAPAKPTAPLPAVNVHPAAVSDRPSTGQIADVGARVSTDLASIASINVRQATRIQTSGTPKQPVPLATSSSRTVADVASPVSRIDASLQTTGLKMDEDPSVADVASAGTGTTPVQTDSQVARTGGSSPTVASVGTPVRYMALDTEPTTASQSASTFSSSSMDRAATLAPAAVTPMSAPVVPAPGPTPTGLIVSNGGVTGTVSNLLGTTENAIFNNSSTSTFITSGGLQVSSANITQGYSTLSLLGLPLLNLTPVGTVLTSTTGTVVGGTGINSHLTLIGAVKSGNYISDINNGAAGGLLGLVLPKNAPDWASTCLNVLGVLKEQCWAVNAAQDNQVLMGDGATANGSEEVVIGTNASHTLPTESANTVFPGDGNRNSKTDPMGVPTDDYQARKGHSVVIGDSANGSQNMQTILGANATSDQANSVALGYGSNASRGALANYTNAPGLEGKAQNSAGEVAVGNAGHDRQITHVAAGTQAHDAVNVAQLEGVMNSSSAGNVKYNSTTTNGVTTYDYSGVTLAGKTSTDGGVTNGTTITNLHQGTLSKTSTDAVNGSQLYATNQNVTNNTTNITNNTKDITTNTKNVYNLQQDALLWNPTIGAYDASHHSGSPQKISNVAAGTAPTDAANVSQLNGVIADTAGSVKYNSTTVNGKKTYDYSGVTLAGKTSTDGGVTNGTTITNLHQGKLSKTSTDAVNGSQLYATNQNVTNNTTNITKNTKNVYQLQQDALQWNPNIGAYDASHGTKSPQKISNVADGTAATDAVNLSQLQGYVKSNGAVQYDSTTKNGKKVINYDSVTLAGTTSTDGGATNGTTISNLHQGALSALSTDAVNGSQLFATNSILAKYMGGVTSYAGTTNTWVPPDFTVVGFDSKGNTTEGHYDNVTDAFLAVDASLKYLNNKKGGGGQSPYFKAKTNEGDATASGDESVAMGGGTVASGTGTVAAGSDAQATSAGAVAIGHNASATDGQAVAIGSGAQASGDGAVSIGDPNVANGTGAVALGKDNTATGTGAVALGNQSKATADGAVAIGNGATSSVKGGVAIGTGSVADRANTVSVGSKGNERQITNVAAGTADTDAVNVSQLKASTNGTVRYDINKNGTVNYNSVTLGQPGGGGGQTIIHNVAPGKAATDAVNVAQLDAVKNWAQQYSNQQFRDLSQHAYAGVASAMAMAGLPQAYLPGKSMASIAGGTFHGESSMAIGVSMISDNGRWVFKLSGSEDTRGDAGGSVGVGIQW